MSFRERSRYYSLTINTVSLKVLSALLVYVFRKMSMYWGKFLMGLRISRGSTVVGGLLGSGVVGFARGGGGAGGVGEGGVGGAGVGWTAGVRGSRAESKIDQMNIIGVDNCKGAFSLNHFYREL